MPSLTQREEPSWLRRLSNVFLFLYMRDFDSRKGQTFRGAITYIWYFSQMTGLLVVCSKKSIPVIADDASTNVLYSYWDRAMIYTRFSPILSAFSQGFAITAFYLALLLCLDIFFLFYFFSLTNSSTKIHENNFKRWQARINFIGMYVDYFKWFYLTLKSELIFARYLCANGGDNRLLCEYLPEFTQIGAQSAILDILTISNMLTLAICCPLVFTVNHSPEFTPSNPLKTLFSEMKLLEYSLIVFSQYFAFLADTSFAFIVINLKVAYYLAEYIFFYPLYRSDLSGVYFKTLVIFGYCSVLLTIREFTTYLSDDIHLEILFIGSAFLYGLTTTIQRAIRVEIRTISLSDISLITRPNVICEYFQEILSLYEEHKQSNTISRLALHGILTTHQSTCCDKLCPCQQALPEPDNHAEKEQPSAKQLHQQQQQQQQKKQKHQRKGSVPSSRIVFTVHEEKVNNTEKGVYMTELMRSSENFERWIFEFINYHFRLLICRAKKQRNFNIEIITMKFWFFLINHRHNVINGLYTIKSQIADFPSKSFFLNIIDIAVTRIIENSIKQKDRSLKYSFRKKDMEEAIQFEIFEQFVLSEVIKDSFKVKLMRLLDEKIALMQNMIEGYENLDGMERQMLSLIESSANLERVIKQELRFASTNLHYLKMLSILRIRVQNDPIFASKIEKKIDEVHSKSLTQDVNLIHSLTVLKGNVISIIASFKKEKGKILKYSERAPQFFGYKKAAFDSSVKSVLQLMPSCISVNHDQIIERLIVEGQPKIMRTYRVAIAKDKDDFLFPIKIYVNYYFQINDDFVFSALILKLSSDSKFLLINNFYQIEGFTRTYLDFFNTIDADITIDLLDKLPIKLFLPDLPKIIESDVSDAKPRIETLKIPMILPDNCMDYFLAYKAYVKKMQGSGKDELQLAEQFVRRSKKYFSGNILIFDWVLNVTQDRFSLLNGFEFTVYLLEIVQIIPVQTFSNGLQNASCGMSINNSMRQSMNIDDQSQVPLQNQKRDLFFDKNDSTMFTQQYSQTAVRNRFMFQTTQPTHQAADSFFDSTPKLSPQGIKLDTLPESKRGKSKEIEELSAIKPILSHNNNSDTEPILSQQQQQQPQQKHPQCVIDFTNQSNLSVLRTIQMEDSPKGLQLMTENSHNQLLPNSIPQQQYLLTTESQQQEEVEDMKFTYNDLDAAGAEGSAKNQPNLGFPIRMDVNLQSTESIPVTPSSIQQQLMYMSQESTNKQKEEVATALEEKKIMSVINEQTVLESSNDFEGEIPLLSAQNNHDSQLLLDKQTKKILDSPSLLIGVIAPVSLPESAKEQEEGLLDNDNNSPETGNDNSYFDIYFGNASAIAKSSNHINQMKKSNSTSKTSTSQQINKEPEATGNEALKASRFQQEKQEEHDASVNNHIGLTVMLIVHQQQDGGSNNQVDSQKSDSEKLNKQSTKRDIKLQLNEKEGERACSVASSQNSQVSTTIQRIYYSASSKRIPFFMGLFFQVIGFQLFFFGTICVIVSLVFHAKYNGLQNLSNELNFNSKVLAPYAQHTVISNSFAMQYTQYVNLTQTYLDLNREIQNSTLAAMQKDMYSIINQQVAYPFQEEYLVTLLEMNFASEGTLTSSQVFFFESIKIVFANLFFIHAMQPSSLRVGEDYIYAIDRNYLSIDSIVTSKVIAGVDSAISDLQASIESINSSAISLSCALLFLCFILLAYPFWRYSQYVKGVLLSVSRMTEKEAEEEIMFCKFIGSLLKASDEKYLSIKYTNFELNSISNEDFAFSAAQFNTLTKRTSAQKTSQKKNYMLSQRISQPRISLLHFATFFSALFLFSITIFISAYILINSFNQQLLPCISAYQHFLSAEQQFSSFIYSSDLLFMQRVMRIQNSTSTGLLNTSFLSQVSTKRTLDLEEFTTFFESEFLVLTEKSIFSSTSNDQIGQIQKNSLCSRTDIFSPLQLETCSILPTMQQGLKAVMSSISNEIGMKFIDVWTDTMVMAHINSGEYERQMKMVQLTFIALKHIESVMLTDIMNNLESYNQRIIIIYLLGGLFYTFAFIAVCRSVYRNIYTRFFLIKKTVHLVPYKRLQEDQTTINLIRNALEQ